MIKSITIKESQHFHIVDYRIYLDNDNYMVITEYCVECGKVIGRRRVKTEPMEVEE